MVPLPGRTSKHISARCFQSINRFATPMKTHHLVNFGLSRIAGKNARRLTRSTDALGTKNIPITIGDEKFWTDKLMPSLNPSQRMIIVAT